MPANAHHLAGATPEVSFRDDRTSGWGSLVRRKWMAVRTQLQSAIAKAERRAADAAPKKKNDK